MRILIVDDQPRRLETLERILRDQRRVERVGIARDGVEAFELLGECHPDVILMGTAMARADGLTTMRLLRRLVKVPVVVLAEPPEVESVLDALALGAVGFLSLEETEESGPADLRGRLDELCHRALPIRESALSRPGQQPSIRVLAVPAGALSALGDLLRAERKPESALYAVLDVPRWFVSPLARRLHRSTPWRVLDAAPGDRFAPGHALLASLGDGLCVVQDSRVRLERGAVWRDLDDVVAATTARRVALSSFNAAGDVPPGVS